MKIVNEGFLDTVRGLRRCEHCGKAVPGCEPHHILPKGMGGGGRMDIPPNIIGLCHLCHQKFHDGNLERASLLWSLSKKLKMTPEEILEECYRVRALPKGSTHGYETQQRPPEESRGIRF